MIKDLKVKTMRFLAGSHTAGPTLSNAIDVCRGASDNGWKITLCLWERPYDTPALVAFQYVRALNAIADMKADCRLSIKLTAIHFSSTLLSDVVWHAKALDIPLHIDAQHPEAAPQSFALLEYGLKRYQNIGYTLPARWQRSVRDAEKILDLQIPVRIVKGQWNDPSGQCNDVRRRYLKLIDMFAGSKNYVSVATHEARLAKEAVRMLRESGTQCELEQMLGLPWLSIHDVNVHEIGRRLYIPYGYPSMPYNISFALERPKIVWWILRDSFLRTDEKLQHFISSPHFSSQNESALSNVISAVDEVRKQVNETRKPVMSGEKDNKEIGNDAKGGTEKESFIASAIETDSPWNE